MDEDYRYVCRIAPSNDRVVQVIAGRTFRKSKKWIKLLRKDEHLIPLLRNCVMHDTSPTTSPKVFQVCTVEQAMAIEASEATVEETAGTADAPADLGPAPRAPQERVGRVAAADRKAEALAEKAEAEARKAKAEAAKAEAEAAEAQARADAEALGAAAKAEEEAGVEAAKAEADGDITPSSEPQSPAPAAKKSGGGRSKK